ncbi:MAG: hypothetical protein MUP09_11310, partial [Thiovulaceae bacterium]|nr:hypothetical protein [Sulfurimonadaceae bacterium]
GRALTFSIKSDGQLVRGLKLEGEDNRLGEKAVDTLTFKAEEMAMDRFDLKKMKIDKSRVGFDGRLTLYGGRDIVGSGSVAFSGAEVALEGLNGEGAKVINDLLGEIHQFGAYVDVAGSWQAPSIKVASDLDRQLSGAFKKVMAKEAEKYKKELKRLLDGQLKEQMNKLDERSHGFMDTANLLDQQNLSLDRLEQKAKALLDGHKSKDQAEEKAKDYLKERENQGKVKKLLGF